MPCILRPKETNNITNILYSWPLRLMPELYQPALHVYFTALLSSVKICQHDRSETYFCVCAKGEDERP